jgi:hypothetical protein
MTLDDPRPTPKRTRLRRAARLAILTLAVAAGAHAAVPSRMAYQGRLLDASKNPRNGSFSMTFRICDTKAGDCSSPVWTETQPSVAVTNGSFAVQLGSYTALGESTFDDIPRYLEVEVGGETLSPRQRLVASPYAFRAAVAEDVDAAETKYVLSSSVLQTGATFYVSSGTVAGDLSVGGDFRATGPITAGSGANVVTTAAGLLDASKLTNTVPNASVDAASVTKQGNTFNGASQLVRLDGSAGLTLTNTLTLSGVTDDIATPSGQDLALMPGGTGKVGVGLTSPSAMLHVSSSNVAGLADLLVLSSGTSAGQEVVTVSTAGNVVADGFVSRGNAVAQVYDSAGGTAVGTTYVSIPWNSQTVVDPLFSHDTGSNNTRVAVNRTGLYRVRYNVGLDNTTTTRTGGLARCLANGSTVVVPSQSASYNRTSAVGEGTLSATFLASLTAGDYIEIQAARTASGSNLTTVANASWVLLELIR